MKVNLIDYQPNALEILIYTKNTRLQGKQTLQDIIDWSYEKKIEHFEYMKDTIKSSFEFCRYVFEIKDVSRNFTHQLVRTRTQSYAQESLRAVDVRNHKFLKSGLCDEYDNSVDFAMENYSIMIDEGIPTQDARGVLPSDILTNIIVGTDLRTLHETAKVRLCYRTQGEYQNVFKAMKAEIEKVHPWAVTMINVACVDSGICCFPRYTECPIQDLTVKISDTKKLAIDILWNRIQHEANPVAKNGVTMK